MPVKIESVEDFIKRYSEHIEKKWLQNIKDVKNRSGDTFYDKPKRPEKRAVVAWFRGQPEDLPLLPRVFRFGENIDETEMLFSWQQKAITLGDTPSFDDHDEWLFLMQHHRLPTRLLDWTESAVMALFFAIEQYYEYQKECSKWQKFNPVVYMLNPYILNWISLGCSFMPTTDKDHKVQSPIGKGKIKIEKGYGIANFIGAFSNNLVGHDGPMAVIPKNIHLRMHAQKSCFLIFGKDHRPLQDIFHDTDLCRMEYLTKLFIELTHKLKFL